MTAIEQLAVELDKLHLTGGLGYKAHEIIPQAAKELREQAQRIADLEALVKRHEAALEWLVTTDYSLDERDCFFLVKNVEYDHKNTIGHADTPLAAIEAALEAAKEGSNGEKA